MNIFLGMAWFFVVLLFLGIAVGVWLFKTMLP